MADSMPIRAKLFILLTVGLGTAILGTALFHWQSADLLRFSCYLIIASAAATMKVRLPGIDSNMSAHFLFLLLGVVELSLPETIVMGCISAMTQSLWRSARRPQAIKLIFNFFMTVNAVTASYFAYHKMGGMLQHSMALMLLAAVSVYFICNMMPVSVVVALTEHKPLSTIFTECYFWSFPYYLIGASLVGFISFLNRYIGWQSSLMVLPVVYGIFRSYRLYLERLEEETRRVGVEKQHVEAEKRHVEEVSELHVRTIEALALAIDAKDHTTHKHLHRVRTYAMEIARELGLTQSEIDALRAAALLHDIGKLAVPDHIINKPGRLTPEEFDKMKIHPVVGAEILEKVAFPYPVAPIVRSHHEKWNGSGYPDGLKGEEIPICARILSVVDCFDAMATDRQYRKALPLEGVIKEIVGEAGVSYDPKIVEILRRRYLELERLALSSLAEGQELANPVPYKVERGDSPAAGFESSAAPRTGGHSDFLASIASAQQEAQTLFELGQGLGSSLSLDETLSLVSVKLRKLIPHDAFVTFVLKGDTLVPEFVSGDNFRVFSSLAIPMGEGLCGWVAENVKPIVNGNPMVEPGYADDPKRTVNLRSALAIPLEGVNGLVGVLALYQTEADAFARDHVRVLQAITSKVALSIENALKFRLAENSATTDFLTGLPNARSLFMHLDQELARCKREHSTVAVMVCDLNGFKQINDSYGHLEGDKTLKIFARLLREVCREYDYVARMGGDEFVLIIPNITPEAAKEKAKLLNVLAQQAGQQVCGKDILSLSLGATFYPQDGVDAERLLAEADRKMYSVKQQHHAQTETGFAVIPMPDSPHQASVQ
jgi:diguanylate cyclase (GGDEF)-like protein/putative nucleotidyltransferase with HDIG domain